MKASQNDDVNILIQIFNPLGTPLAGLLLLRKISLEIWTNLGILGIFGRIFDVSQRPYSLDFFPDVPSILNLGANSLKVEALPIRVLILVKKKKYNWDKRKKNEYS